ncbi:Afadin and alpha-actinin-binding-domain-containing protein [Echria macrotheca]|uniref:Afadin and alpha-actinin-binding-domain-containing protein n=1 Tax=Echria macrotheca TaxID=438768 RepID=A0AAJ0B352_9PEZI|nr:Afadin and alpha-actinin-binding-domain-containing protein [Echria macrotheca]
MIELENLRQASLYINNQLLSRGLLRDGQNIDFVHPGDSAGEIAATMGRVISIVNDLILRRDRDAEHRESLSTTLRTLRAESLRQTNDIQRLQEKNADALRKVSLCESSEAALRTQLKTAEATIQKLKDEAARTKVLVAQTRASCANDVRKRDRQIEGLKKAVTEAGRARGASKSPGITTITVVGDVGSEPEQIPLPADGPSGEGYDLRMETNSFLAELAKSLSEENETVVGLIRRTTEQLKEMSGWDTVPGAPNSDAQVLAMPANCAEMSAEIEGILQHLRTILTNPSFVPIEEVVVREDEIHRLRDGWEKMETRWKEAVHLIDGWRRRMQVSGRPVNVEELKMGLRLSPVRVQNVEETAQGLGLRLEAVPEDTEEPSIMHSPCPAGPLDLVPAPELEDPDVSDCESSIFEDDVDVDELDVEEPNIEILEQSVMIHSPPLPIPPQMTPLQNSSSAGNRGVASQPNQRKRAVDFSTIVEENTWDLKPEAPLPPPAADKPQQSPKKKPAQPPRPIQQQDDAPPPTMADLTASASSIGSVQLVKTPNESAPKAPISSARGRAGRVSPTGRMQDTPPVSRPKAAVPSRANSARERSRPRAEKKPEQGSKATRSASATATLTSSGASGPSPPNKSTDVMPPPPLPSANATPARDRSPKRANSRLPLPRTGANILPPPQQSPLSMATIAAKLAASERDADAARVRAKLKAARMGVKKRVSLAPEATETDAGVAADASRSTRSDDGATGADAAQEAGAGAGKSKDKDEDEDELAPRAEEFENKPRKRERRTSKVASRRRSTLNPWELGALIQGNVGVTAAAEEARE